MTEAQSWKEFFDDFKHKPNWEFHYEYLINYNDHKLVMVMYVPNSRVPLPEPEVGPHRQRQNVPLIPITQSIMLDVWFGEEHAKSYLRFLIDGMENHEIDEWFRYKDELVFDPH